MCHLTGAKFEYSLLIGLCSNHQSLMLVTSHVRSALCTLISDYFFVNLASHFFLILQTVKKHFDYRKSKRKA